MGTKKPASRLAFQFAETDGLAPARPTNYLLAAEAGAAGAAADAAGAAFDAAEAAGAALEAGAAAGAAAEAGAEAGAASSFLPQAARARTAIMEANNTDFFICILKRQINGQAKKPGIPEGFGLRTSSRGNAKFT